MKTHLLLLFVFVFTFKLFAQTGSDKLEKVWLFEPISETLDKITFSENDEVLKLTLKYDIPSFIRHKEKGEYLDAAFVIHLSEADSTVKNIRLEAHGNSSREQCLFPPIYLNFKTDPIQNTELNGINKIKLVTHCSNSKSYKEYILKKYLVYKLLNILTDNSFRVKMLVITHIDTGKKGRNYKQRGFLIEPIELLCQRMEATELDPKLVRGNDIDELYMDVAALFNYMIANTDWRVKSGHKVKFIESLHNGSIKLASVLYDFDFSGLVGAGYAKPQEWTSVKTIYERQYLDYCRDNKNAYFDAVKIFTTKKNEEFITIDTFHFLDEKNRKNIYKYVKRFYNLTKKPDVLVSIMKHECRSIDL